MKHIIDDDEERQIEKKENEYYKIFLDKAIQYANKKYEGGDFKQLVSTASVIARRSQSRSATRMLKYQMDRDFARGLLIPETEAIGIGSGTANGTPTEKAE